MFRSLGLSALIALQLPASGQDIPSAHLSDTARLFGRDAISRGDFIFNATFTRDGHTVFFSKATINWGYIAIFSSTEKHSQWSPPEPAPFTGTYRDTDPFVSSDGTRLYFSSDRPLPGKPYVEYDYHLFYVPMDGHKPGSDPIPVNVPLPEGVHISYPTFAANGDLYFSSWDSLRDSDIYCARFLDNAFQMPERLAFNDPKIVDLDPIVSKDETFLIFCSLGRKGFGGSDLWISFRDGDSWSTPLNMGPKVNTVGSDGAPGLSPDNKKLYFCSYREKSPRPVYQDGHPSADAVEALFHSAGNGMRQIYEIDISDLISSSRRNNPGWQ